MAASASGSNPSRWCCDVGRACIPWERLQARSRSSVRPIARHALALDTIAPHEPERRSAGTRQIQRPGAPLVGPGQRIPPAAPDQSAALGLDRPAGAAGRQAGARRGLRRRHPVGLDGAQGRQGARHRPGDQGAAGGTPACARSRDARHRIPRRVGRSAGGRDARAVRRRHLHGDARARAGSAPRS